MQKKIRISNKSLTAILLALLLVGVTKTQGASAFYQDASQKITEFVQYKGEILDKDSKKPLVFASLTITDSNISTITNTEGQFALKVPSDMVEGTVTVSFLGYKSKTIQLSSLFESKNNKVLMEVSIMELSGVDLSIPKNAKALVKETLQKKGENYFDDPTLMTAFYRETIKKRRKNVKKT